MSEEWHKTHAVQGPMGGFAAPEIHKRGCERLSSPLLPCSCGEGSVLPTMTSLEQIKQDVAALREARADDERARGLALEQLKALNMEVGTNSRIMDAFLLRLEAVEEKLVGIGNCLAGLLTLGAKAPRKSKRKPRGRKGK
jgi:hypothetical protein